MLPLYEKAAITRYPLHEEKAHDYLFLTPSFSAAVHLTPNPTRSTIEHPPSLLSIHDRDFNHVGLCLSMEAY